MIEQYILEIENGRPIFTKRKLNLPPFAQDGKLPAEKDAFEAFCRMGDPDLLECLVYRGKNSAGGIFHVRDKYGPLYVAVAESALAWSLALGHFGEMTANVRYGVDVFENMDEKDD